MIVASNRGPERFQRAGDGSFTRRRGAGGLVSALRPLLGGTDATWVAAAIGDDDRAAAEAGAATSDDFDLHLLAFDPPVQRLHYNVISNAVLWFLHHGLFDLTRRPSFGERLDEAWAAYTAVNERFADEIAGAAHEDEVVLVHDYHLALVPGMLAARRRDVRTVFFQHTPFCGPNSMRVLPDRMAEPLLSSMAVAPVGFHTDRWARAYRASAREVLGVDAPVVEPFAASLGPDPAALADHAASPECAAEGQALDELVGDRRLVLRVDRIEPSKNILRGFQAFELMLERHPAWRERVVFGALVYPSREGLAEYLAYRQEVEQAADEVNTRWATGDWTPVILDTDDTYPRSLAGLKRYDVLLVNPIKDGLNLVAKEGPLLNERDGMLVLSREAGAFDELSEAALAVNPYDLVGTADALAAALGAEEAVRADRARRLRELAGARTTREWLDDLLAAAEPSRS